MWTVIWWILLIPYLLVCLGLIAIVLLQKGKGAGFAGAFGLGAGGADTVFGPRATKSLPVKLTYGMAAVFLVLALLLSIVSGRAGRTAAPELVETEAAMVPAEEAPESPVATPEGLVPAGDAGAAADAPEPAGSAAEAPAVPGEPVETPAEAPAPAGEPVETPAEAPAPAGEPVETPAEAPAPTEPGEGVEPPDTTLTP